VVSSQKVDARSRASRSADITADDMYDFSSGAGRLPTAAWYHCVDDALDCMSNIDPIDMALEFRRAGPVMDRSKASSRSCSSLYSIKLPLMLSGKLLDRVREPPKPLLMEPLSPIAMSMFPLRIDALDAPGINEPLKLLFNRRLSVSEMFDFKDMFIRSLNPLLVLFESISP